MSYSVSNILIIYLYGLIKKSTFLNIRVLKAFEIAQHFMTMCGSDMNKIGREEFVPAKEFQLRWCQYYLAGLHDIPLESVSL